MVLLLPPEERKKINKEKLETIERDIIRTLQWDLQWASPTLYAERFQKLMNVHQEPTIAQLSKRFCKNAIVYASTALNYS